MILFHFDSGDKGIHHSYAIMLLLADTLLGELTLLPWPPSAG